MGASIDTSELRSLAAEQYRAVAAAAAHARTTVAANALRVKEDAREGASGLRHAPAYPYSIGYDLLVHADGIEAVIGPDKDKRQGALGNLLEYGSVKNAPIPHLGPALDRVEAQFVADMSAPFERML